MLELPEHGRGRVRRERESAFGREALDRLEEPDERELSQVFVRLTSVHESASKALGKRDVTLDDAVPQRGCSRVRRYSAKSCSSPDSFTTSPV